MRPLRRLQCSMYAGRNTTRLYVNGELEVVKEPGRHHPRPEVARQSRRTPGAGGSSHLGSLASWPPTPSRPHQPGVAPNLGEQIILPRPHHALKSLAAGTLRVLLHALTSAARLVKMG